MTKTNSLTSLKCGISNIANHNSGVKKSWTPPLHLTNPGLAYSQILLARIYEPLVLVNTVLICFVMRYKRVNPNVFGAYIQWGFLIGILREMSKMKTEHSFTITMNVRFGLCPRESLSPLVLECSFLLVFCHIWSFSRIQCCFRQR